MKKIVFLFVLAVLFSSHDMYLKLDTYFLEPNSPARIQLFNGTFEKSDNTIDRNRMLDVSLVSNGERRQVDTAQWTENEGVTILNFTTGDPGTYLAGVSTRARSIELAAADFNNYLEHDGVLDMLEWRKEQQTLDQDAVEKYSKHVKTIFQVSDKLTDDWQTKLGYPIEFVPLQNPYDLHPGHDMEVQLLWTGNPLPDQLVYVYAKPKAHQHTGEHTHNHEQEEAEAHQHEGEHAHSHEPGKTETHQHDDRLALRTDAEGKVRFSITHQGIWYLRTIYLTHSKEPGLTHESNWATLTFEVGDGHHHHAEAGHQHEGEHGHSHEEPAVFGLPAYAYWIGSFVLVLGLFLWFNRKKA